MGSSNSKNKGQQSSGGTAVGVSSMPSDNLPKKDVILRKKLDSAVKTGVLNLVDMVNFCSFHFLVHSCIT